METTAWLPAFRSVRAAAFTRPSPERALRLVTVSLVLLGLMLRARGFVFSTLSLWQDEASWAIRLMERPLLDDLIRPIGFMAVTRWLAFALGPSERVLRFLPWCGGIATVLMAPALSRALFRSWASRLLFVAVLCLDPAAIDLSKEFKPYALGLALHAGLLLLVLRYVESKKPRALALALGVACVAVLFAQDVMFLYPGLFVVLVVAAFRAKRTKHVIAVVGASLVALGTVLCLYHFVWSHIEHGKEERYWGKKYDVFYVSDTAKSDRSDWTVKRYMELVAMPGSRRSFWDAKKAPSVVELGSFDAILWVFLHVAGLTMMVRWRKPREALLLASPLFLLTAFNVLGFWPLGDFRTNLFTLVYSAAIASFGIDRRSEQARFSDLLPAVLLVLVPLFSFERNWHASKRAFTASTDFPDALAKLIRLQGPHYAGPREPLLVDQASCEPWQYYASYHPTISRQLGPSLKNRFALQCHNDRAAQIFSTARRDLQGVPRVWVLASGAKLIRALARPWPDDLDRVAFARIATDEHLVAAAARGEVVVTPHEETEPAPDTDADGDTDLK